MNIKRIREVVFGKLGIDGAILYTSSARIIQAGGGIVTAFLIAKFLSKEEQGFYFTFASVLAIQIFFELGLGGILTQFVAHEMAHIRIKNNTIEGDKKHISRLASILHFSVKWYAVFAFLLLLALTFGGSYFFYRNTLGIEHIQWRTPWLIVAFFAGSNLLLSPIMAILQGMHKVKEMARLALIQQITVMSISWLSLVLGAKLYVVAINAMVGFIVLVSLYLGGGYAKILYTLWKQPIVEKISYWQEIFPLQWKIALSWASGYFIFQAFNPIVFAFYGPVVAGQVGMTLTILNAILSLVVSWTSTKIPLWSSLIARREYKELDNSVESTLTKSSLVAVLVILGALAFIVGLQYFDFSLGNRFLSLPLCAVFFLSVPFNNIINTWATALRCFKREPFLFQAFFIGLCCVFEMYITAKYFTIETLIGGYLIIVICVSLPMSYYIFKTKKQKYYESI